MWSKVKNAAKKVGRAASGLFVQGVNVVKEAANRVFGVVDFLGTLAGIRPRKKLRLKVVILRDETGKALATHSEVQPSVDYAKEALKRAANIDVVPARGGFIETIPSPLKSPPEALEMTCGFDTWKSDLGKAGDHFAMHQARNASGILTGYAAPVTVFIIRHIANRKGCSLGPLVDYVLVDLAGIKSSGGTPIDGGPGGPGDGGDEEEDRPPIVISGADDSTSTKRPRLLVHELSHICGLWHSSDTRNLAHPSGPGIRLRKRQQAIMRNSRFVTYV